VLDPVGFWSYTRDDDYHSDGQLSELRAIVGKAMNMQHGAKVALWQDIEAIDAGVNWEAKIEQAIGKTTFFIPIVTPRFLKSKYCFDEFVFFRKRMISLGRDDLIFPVHYVAVDYVQPTDTFFGDDLAGLRRHQWVDFTSLFYAQPKSAETKKWAFDLAASILRALRRQAPPLVIQSPTQDQHAALPVPIIPHPIPDEPCSPHAGNGGRSEETERLRKLDDPGVADQPAPPSPLAPVLDFQQPPGEPSSPLAGNRLESEETERLRKLAEPGIAHEPAPPSPPPSVLVVEPPPGKGSPSPADSGRGNKETERLRKLDDPGVADQPAPPSPLAPVLDFQPPPGKGSSSPADSGRGNESVEYLWKLAERGDAVAQYTIGVLYRNGQGVAQDYAQALSWFRKAAYKGHESAQFSLGEMFENGRGTDRDLRAAAAWYRKAAKHGNAEAKRRLRMLEFRIGRAL